MRRTKLIWFAAGAATAGIAISGAGLLLPKPERHAAFLLFEEPVDPDGGVSDDEMIANRTGEMLRNCGAKIFQTTFLYEDHLPTADLPITAENEAAFACALSAAVKDGYRMNIELRTDRNAQTH